MKLLPNEEKILNFKNDTITLTNLRINFTEPKMGQTYSSSIFLENISSVETKFTNSPTLIILSVIILTVSLLMKEDYALYGSILSGVLFIAWMITRKFLLFVSSNGGASISFQIHNVDDEQIDNFIYELSLAKQKRINQIHKL